MLQKIKDEQIEIFEQLKLVKRKYTKINVERRTEEKINELITEIQRLVKAYESRDQFITEQGDQSEHLEEVKNLSEEISEFLQIELNKLGESDCESIVEGSFSSEMALVNKRDIMMTVNKCIPIFNGEQKTSLNADIANFVMCCRAVHSMFDDNADKEYFFSFLKTRFQGKAFQLMSQHEFKSIEEIENILKEYYIPKPIYIEVKSNLVKAKQSHNESIFEFGQRVINLLCKCKEVISEKYIGNKPVIESLIEEEETLAVRHFRQGLANRTIELRLSCMKLEKIKDAIDKAVEIEHEEKESKSNFSESLVPKHKLSCSYCGKLGHLLEDCWYATKSSQGRQSESSNNFHNNKNLRENRSFMEAGPSNFNKNNFNNGSGSLEHRNNPFSQQNKVHNEFICYSCGKKGHTSRNCRYNNTAHAKVRTVNQSNSFVFCQFCKKANHSTINCSQFNNCLKGLLAQQQSGNEEGQLEGTTAAVHKSS